MPPDPGVPPTTCFNPGRRPSTETLTLCSLNLEFVSFMLEVLGANLQCESSLKYEALAAV